MTEKSKAIVSTAPAGPTGRAVALLFAALPISPEPYAVAPAGPLWPPSKGARRAMSHSDPTLRRLGLRRRHWILAGVLVLALAVRLAGLTRESLWLDEIATIDFVEGRGWAEVVTSTFRVDFHPFAYYALLDLWCAAFGATEHACRLLSALLGVASVAAVHRLAMTVTESRATALMAASIVAVAPAHVWYSQECRMYILLVLTWTLCVDALIRLVRSDFAIGRSATFLGTFVAFGYAHGSAGVVTLPFLLAAVLTWGRGELLAGDVTGSPRRGGRWRFRRRLAVAGVMILAYTPWIVRLLALGGDTKVLGRLGAREVRELVEWLILFEHVPSPVGLLVFWGAVTFAAAFLVLARRRRGPASAAGLVAASVIAPLVTVSLLSLVVPLHQNRNLLFLLPPAVVLASYAFVGATTAFAARASSAGRGIAVGAAVAAVIAGLGFLARLTAHDVGRVPQKENWRAAARYILDGTSPGDVLAFYAGFTEPCFAFYAADDGRSGSPPRVSGEPPGPSHGLSIVTVAREPEAFPRSAADLLDRVASGAASVWVVYSHVPRPESLDALLRAGGLFRRSVADFRGVVVVSYARDSEAGE